jgi:hypothetical protein
MCGFGIRVAATRHPWHAHGRLQCGVVSCLSMHDGVHVLMHAGTIGALEGVFITTLAGVHAHCQMRTRSARVLQANRINPTVHAWIWGKQPGATFA